MVVLTLLRKFFQSWFVKPSNGRVVADTMQRRREAKRITRTPPVPRYPREDEWV